MPRTFVEAHTPIRPISRMEAVPGDMVAPWAIDERTGSGVCPFLGLDDRCSVYDDRPDICRVFGDESSSVASCAYQDKDGRARSRQERRAVERDLLHQKDVVLRMIRDELSR